MPLEFDKEFLFLLVPKIRHRIYPLLFWKKHDGKNTSKGYGTMVVKTWYWYENWLKEVEKYCQEHKGEF